MKGKLNIYYDEEGDYLEIFIKKGTLNYGEDVSPGITIFRDEETDEVIGIGVLNFRKKARNLKDLELNLPFEINFEATRLWLRLMRDITKKELEEYDQEVREKAKKFKLNPEDFHNLYDLFWMVNSSELDIAETLKLNKMDKWFQNFTARVERILFDEDFALV